MDKPCGSVLRSMVTPRNHIQTEQIFPTDQNIWNILEDNSMSVSAAILKHRIICFGYVIQEATQPGRLNAALLKSKGIAPGPLYARIKSGETIYTDDGLEIKPEEVLHPPCPGRKLVILGDTCDSQQITDFALNADVVVHEATNENAHQEKCIENGHSTPGNKDITCTTIMKYTRVNYKPFYIILVSSFRYGCTFC